MVARQAKWPSKITTQITELKHTYKPGSLHQSEGEVPQSYQTVCDLWTVAHQAFPSTGFSRQEHWSGVPFHSPGDLLNAGIEPRSPTLQADALTLAPPGKPLDTKIQSQKTSYRDTELQI